jgi:hypothetical protein
LEISFRSAAWSTDSMIGQRLRIVADCSSSPPRTKSIRARMAMRSTTAASCVSQSTTTSGRCASTISASGSARPVPPSRML